MPKTTNPYRIAAIRALRAELKEPQRTMGVSPSWIWLGRKYTFPNRTDHLERHFIPDVCYDLLDGPFRWVEGLGGAGKAYPTREAASAAFERARARLEEELP